MINTICLVILFVALGIYAVFQKLFNQKHKAFFEPLDAKEYSYKAFLPGCLGIVEVLKLSGTGRYQARLNQKIAMLHGNRYLAFYSLVHWSVKVFYAFLGLWLGSLFCILGNTDAWGLLIIPAAAAGLFFLADKNLDDQYRERRFKLEKDFPDFVSKLVLLIHAGLNVRQAIERIVSDQHAKNLPLYQELLLVLTDIQGGSSETEAYSDFAERCKIRQITNFVSILQQNMKLGGSQMLFELKRMGTECWEMRKNMAKQLGERASSKLMLPLAIMFIAVVLICVAPVILDFRRMF
ncbi:MAG: type II secretion system F family protein [Clostridia bacterium]|nr:type II secretion system F family protein [Clostridia bacterium]